MSFTLNRRPAEEPPVESVTLTLDMQQFTALATLVWHGISGDHPLNTLVGKVISDLPPTQREQIDETRRVTPMTVTQYPGANFAAEMLG